MIKITQAQLEEIIENHNQYLKDNDNSKRARFVNIDLSGMNLTQCNLQKAIFSNVNLKDANCSNGNFINA